MKRIVLFSSLILIYFLLFSTKQSPFKQFLSNHCRNGQMTSGLDLNNNESRAFCDVAQQKQFRLHITSTDITLTVYHSLLRDESLGSGLMTGCRQGPAWAPADLVFCVKLCLVQPITARGRLPSILQNQLRQASLYTAQICKHQKFLLLKESKPVVVVVN